ncbi:MAG: trifunctional serine/threonine-protein kinase/ATP-binding protein/SpoIIE family protein phosphatase [Microscillaceae bacterium]|jgi:predicted ATPase/serine phosphatase RsbU (regulator of sigma subunit)|nr:trifunctional serine/threonine-protein kinase/ATP-binding protein/SpoIIE family protein phosphatase [Microscillaceae bacterium]
MQILNFDIVETLHQSENTTVWLGLSQGSLHKRILKTSAKPFSDFEEDARIEYEYEILQDLKNLEIPQALEIQSFNGKPILIREFAEGQSLKKYLTDNYFSIPDFLQSAIQLTELLGKIHQANIIHKDLNANNIIYNPQTKSSKIVDFGIASRIDLKSQNMGNPGRLEGTLAYISPEQTGRMNRVVDYRSDLYSLGITFYEMLTNQLPFQFEDALELAHAHIARTPLAPHLLRKEIPEILSAIVLKLLAKNAEDRYQSALGLHYDLKLLHDNWHSEAKPNFRLGAKDYPLKFQIPQKLYGRETELSNLLNAFEYVVNGNKELFLISGDSGVGKSALVAEVHKPITAQRGLFLEGKFDQLQKNIPYFGWQQVFNQLSEVLLTETQENLEVWREKIQYALGSLGKVLTDLNPNLELIIGKQAALPELDAVETQNRFNYAVKAFIATIAQAEHPLVVFIDDWQWADIPSIELLQNIYQDADSRHLLLICAYRSNEVLATHPFALAVNDMQSVDNQAVNSLIQNIHLSNLQMQDVEKLLVDTLRDTPEKLQSLAQLLFEKTQGNAFFVNQLLKTLYEEKHLQLNFTQEGFHWEWDIEAINRLNISENVVNLMIKKIRKLSEASQQTLKIAACIGNYFDLKTLASIYQKPLRDTYQTLWEGMREGLVIPTDGAKRLHSYFRFVHDRVQQACYELIAEIDKKPTHYRLGKVLLEVIPPEIQENRVFDIVNQFNQGKDLASDDYEKHQIARFNLLASQKAQSSAAYAPALVYAQIGVDLLTASAWQNDYQLAWDLHREKLENTYLMGKFAETQPILDALLQNSHSKLDKIKAYEVQLSIYKAQGKLNEAVDLGLLMLEMLGVRMPKPTTVNIIWQMLQAKNALKIKNLDRLLDYKLCTDEEKLAIERILMEVGSVVYFAAPKLIPILTATQVKQALKNGNSIYSPYSYISFALMLIGGMNDIENGYQLGQIGEALKKKLNPKKIEGKIDFIHNVFVKHWKDPISQAAENLRRNHTICMEMGDFEFASFSASVGMSYAFLASKNLREIDEQSRQYLKVVRERTKQAAKYEEILSNYQIFAFLLGKSNTLETYEGKPFNEADLIQKLQADNKQAVLQSYRACKAYLALLFENYAEAEPFIADFQKNIDAAIGSAFLSFFWFVKGLLAANAGKAKEVKIVEKKLKKWAKHSPVNYLHKLYLLQAEQAAISQKIALANQLYSQAIQEAQKNNYLNDAALACELYGKFLLRQNQEALATYFLQNAGQLYGKWGAIAKVEHLQSKYSSYLKGSGATSGTMLNTHNTTTSGRRLQSLDVLSIVKSSQAISGEIVLGRLVEKMMEVIIENAGAERGILLLANEQGKLYIEAEIDLPKQSKKILTHIALGKNSENILPENIINYAVRSRETVVLADALHNEKFSQSAYIQAIKPKSVLCTPLLKQAKLIGVVYLENNLASGAFSEERLEILKLLSSQVAISIENALFYEDLEEKVKERTLEVMKQKELIEEQKDLIEHKNKNITASINYAKNIQKAMLLTEKEVREILPESFVFYRPRDIVSGDFYWFQSKNEVIYAAAIDCTGHGVPGALMSAIGNNLLDEMFNKLDLEEPDLILNQLSQSVIKALRQAETKNNDGMDMALLKIDRKNQVMEFAGAKNPLIYIQNGQLFEIKADKMPIGGLWFEDRKERAFTKHIIPLSVDNQPIPTTFYIFSDGFQDQFGGKLKRKYTTTKFKQLLLQIHQLPIEEQEDALLREIEQWMEVGEENQTDDILVIGGRLNY